MTVINQQLPATGNAYLLFGFEAIQARPNLDPYTSTLRTDDETMQVFLSDVHIKHHVRRGLKAEAHARQLAHADQTVFYEKEDEAGKPCNFDLRLQAIRQTWQIAKPDKCDALLRTLDLPLFGYVHAIKNENFNVTNAANTLFRPETFHGCEIYSLGRNNAFPTLDKKTDQIKESAGSATVDELEYGFFLALWEINLNMLRVNAAQNMLIPWGENGPANWLAMLADGMWRAYTSDRFPSFTQRSQFAQFQLGWVPEGEVSYRNPGDLYRELDEKKIKSHDQAVDALNRLLPGFLDG
ncbi:MAG: hypothetical protein PHI35_07540, partial [Victivallaceae bacterium]|nr:hypothetical protein [Victivallaceae bacterium]